MTLFKSIQWAAATAVISVGATFALLHFAYSGFETQRTSDVYRDQIDKRLDHVDDEIARLHGKVDQLLQKRE